MDKEQMEFNFALSMKKLDLKKNLCIAIETGT